MELAPRLVFLEVRSFSALGGLGRPLFNVSAFCFEFFRCTGLDDSG